jgi:hypothetical protein
MSASETEERDVRIAIAVRTTSQSLGWIGTEPGIFHRAQCHFPSHGNRRAG